MKKSKHLYPYKNKKHFFTDKYKYSLFLVNHSFITQLSGTPVTSYLYYNANQKQLQIKGVHSLEWKNKVLLSLHVTGYTWCILPNVVRSDFS